MVLYAREDNNWIEAEEIHVIENGSFNRVFSGHINVNGEWHVFHRQDYHEYALLDFALNRAWPEIK